MRSKNKKDIMTSEEKKWKETDHISKSLEENKRALEERFGLHESFDVMMREMEFGGKKTGLLFIDGYAEGEVLTQILKRLSYLKREDIVPNALRSLLDKYIPHIEVDEVETLKEAIEKVMVGASVLFIEGESTVLAIDAKSFPGRGNDEPSLETVVRGSRDGFNETLLTNTTLVRRRIHDPRFRLKSQIVGRRTRTQVCVGYIHDIVDTTLLDEVRKKIKAIDIDGIPLADKQLEELVIGKGWNPYPLVRYSERPDVIATHLLEGHIVIFVDTSPSAMILPTTFFHHVQHAEEYRQTPFIGTYLRWIRFLGIFASLFLLPLWFLFVIEPELLPTALDFIGPEKTSTIPILLQFIFIEIGVDLLRMAAIHTPTPIATAMGLIAAILIGEIAIEVGLFINEVILYMAVAAVGMFATPSYELGLANRIVRLALLLAVGFFKVPGFVLGVTLFIILLTITRSYNTPYMWPFIPFDAKAFFMILIRRPVDQSKKRPSITKALDNTKMP